MERPRFIAASADDLIDLSRHADPPVEIGDMADLAMPRGLVRMRVIQVDPLVVWNQVGGER